MQCSWHERQRTNPSCWADGCVAAHTNSVPSRSQIAVPGMQQSRMHARQCSRAHPSALRRHRAFSARKHAVLTMRQGAQVQLGCLVSLKRSALCYTGPGTSSCICSVRASSGRGVCSDTPSGSSEQPAGAAVRQPAGQSAVCRLVCVRHERLQYAPLPCISCTLYTAFEIGQGWNSGNSMSTLES